MRSYTFVPSLSSEQQLRIDSRISANLQCPIESATLQAMEEEALFGIPVSPERDEAGAAVVFIFRIYNGKVEILMGKRPAAPLEIEETRNIKQLAPPGGRRNKGEINSWETAIREAEEEAKIHRIIFGQLAAKGYVLKFPGQIDGRGRRGEVFPTDVYLAQYPTLYVPKPEPGFDEHGQKEFESFEWMSIKDAEEKIRSHIMHTYQALNETSHEPILHETFQNMFAALIRTSQALGFVKTEIQRNPRSPLLMLPLKKAA